MNVLRMMTIAFILSISSGCAIYHHYGLYTGKVVDMETSEPIEGAAVLAVYYTQEYTAAGLRSQLLDAQETVTDKNGEFQIPSLNSVAFRSFQKFDTHAWFTIFKPGYGCYPHYPGVMPLFMPNGTLPSDERVRIALPTLKTKESRLNNTDCFPVSIPDQKMRKFIEINNIERALLGLQPTHAPRERK